MTFVLLAVNRATHLCNHNVTALPRTTARPACQCRKTVKEEVDAYQPSPSVARTSVLCRFVSSLERASPSSFSMKAMSSKVCTDGGLSPAKKCSQWTRAAMTPTSRSKAWVVKNTWARYHGTPMSPAFVLALRSEAIGTFSRPALLRNLAKLDSKMLWAKASVLSKPTTSFNISASFANTSNEGRTIKKERSSGNF